MVREIYIDTSVIGGYFDEIFEADTKLFFKEIEKGRIVLLVSDLLEAELLRAPNFVNDLLQSIPKKHTKQIKLTEEAIKLADKYIEAKVVGKTSRADCQHIALATINRADVLISWNFKHIVNLDRIRGYNAINYKLGYPMIEIRTPKEILSYGK